jgi:hypothetical protein
MRRFARPADDQAREPVDSPSIDVEAVLKENANLRELVAHLSALVVKNIHERK